MCRWLYNKMIEKIHNEGFQSRNDLNYFLTELKQSEPWIYNYHSKMLQMVSTEIGSAQKSLMIKGNKRYRTGTLRFRRYDDFLTFTYNQSGFDLTRHGNTDLLYLSKIGFVEIRKHRDFVGNIKQIKVSKSKTEKWHACIIVDVDIKLPEIIQNKMVGLDLGITNFVYDSDGHVTSNPLNLKKMLKPLARVQRKMMRRKNGSHNKKKAVRWYQIIHQRIANKRKDFLHKLSTRYARKYSTVFVEKLTILNMT